MSTEAKQAPIFIGDYIGLLRQCQPWLAKLAAERPEPDLSGVKAQALRLHKRIETVLSKAAGKDGE